MASYPTITIEEHFMSSGVFEAVSASKTNTFSFDPTWVVKLRDIAVDGPRIKSMDSGKVDVQVISSSAGQSSCAPEIAIAANNELAAAIHAQRRFKGFAMLPMKFPAQAQEELTRCIKDLGFVGAMVDSHLNDGRYYDDAAFHSIFATIEKLEVPIYIHPVEPVPEVQTALYQGNYEHKLGVALGISAWGWHCDTALSVLRMYAAGIFSKFPKLKVVIGHMGEMLPYMLDRIDEKLAQILPQAENTFQEVWSKNIWVTTSGMFSLPPMACLLRCTSIDRIIYSVDYPYSDNEQGHAFLRSLGESGLVTDKELAMISYKNAEALLRFNI